MGERALTKQRDASGGELLVLARRDRSAARKRLAELDADELALATQELPPAVRPEFLMLLDHPEQIVPLLPEAELAATIVSGGMSEAAWLLELATAEQRIACIDLDSWRGQRLDVLRLREWIDALIEAGRATLVRALGELDPELLVLALRDLAELIVVSKEDETPAGWFTEDGVCYFRARSDEDHARLREIAQAAFSDAQPLYWQLVYGVLFELPAETEEFALKWRTGRLSDLGFPEREQAMQAYKPLRIEDAPVWELGSGREASLVPFQELPHQLRGTLVGGALAELPLDRAADLLGYVLAVANTVAVADGLKLSDAESIPQAMRKALSGIDRGLAELARARRQEPSEVLDCTKPLDLFRIGATLDPDFTPVQPPLDDELDDEAEDPD